MPAYVPTEGFARPIGLAPTDTAEATLLTAGPENPVLVGLMISNITGSAAAATVKWGDGTTDYSIVTAKSIAANDTFFQDLFVPLVDGGAIKVTSGAGDALVFTAIVVEYGSELVRSQSHGSEGLASSWSRPQGGRGGWNG
tara:strand:- start:5504 stop:5926 length:423 start_codon:yes stop_codon:yes gene_type:complete